MLPFNTSCSYWSQQKQTTNSSAWTNNQVETASKKVGAFNNFYLAVNDVKLTGEISQDYAKPITNSMISELLKFEGIKVIDRANMDNVLSAQGINLKNCAVDSCIVKAGKVLGVNKILVGSISKINESYYFNLQLINVETALLEATAEMMIVCNEPELVEKTRELTNKLILNYSERNR